MSGQGSQLDGYRCIVCRKRRNRCLRCAAARRVKVQELHRAKADRGECLDCDGAAVPGMTRCQLHRDANNARSRASHARRRAANDD